MIERDEELGPLGSTIGADGGHCMGEMGPLCVLSQAATATLTSPPVQDRLLPRQARVQSMSLYSSDIQLLPRWPRSIFSIGADSTRATLPDYANVAELGQFIERLNNWHLHVPHARAQVIFGCTFIFVIIIVVGLIMARRIYEGKFWLIRVSHRMTGSILIPNPVLAFLILSGTYGIVFTPLFLTATLRYINHSGPPPNVILWFTLPFLFLAYGLIWAILGTFFATPGALLSTTDESELSTIGRFLRRADFINSLGLLLPIGMTIAIGVPAIISNRLCTDVFAMEHEWQVRFSLLPTFTQDMVQQSQLVWFQALQAAKSVAIVFILWTIFAFAMGIAYFYVSLTLIVAVRQDLARAKKLENQAQTVNDAAPAVPRVSQIVADALQANRISGKRSNQLGPMSHHTSSALRYNASTKERGVDLAQDPNAEPTAEQQRKRLEQALFQIYLQLGVIGSGATFLGVISLTFALTLYSKLELPSADGGNQFEAWIGGILMTLMYIVGVVGGLNILTVFYKTFEPSAARVFHRSTAGAQIKFADVAKGKAHLMSTFFESHTRNMAASPPLLRHDATGAALVGDDSQRSPTSFIISIADEAPSCDVEVAPTYHSANAWSPSSLNRSLE